MFNLTKEQQEQLAVWEHKHKDACTMKYFGAIGGRYTYSFTPTSLGVVFTVECSCGEKKDLTEYDSW